MAVARIRCITLHIPYGGISTLYCRKRGKFYQITHRIYVTLIIAGDRIHPLQWDSSAIRTSTTPLSASFPIVLPMEPSLSSLASPASTIAP